MTFQVADWQDAQTEAINFILYLRDLPSELKKKIKYFFPFKSQIVWSPGRHFSKLLSIYVKLTIKNKKCLKT